MLRGAFVRDVSNDGNAADYFAVLVVTRRVITFKETVAARLRDDVGTIFSDDAAAGQCFAVEVVFAGLGETIKNVERTFPQHVLAFHAGDAFHRAVPGRVPELTIESDDAVDVSFEQALEKQIFFYLLV